MTSYRTAAGEAGVSPTMTMISTSDLSRLPSIASFRRLTRALAMLDAVLSPDWEARYYSFKLALVPFLRPLVSLLLRDNQPICLANVPREGIVVDTGKIDSDPSATTDIGRTVIDRRILFDERLLQTKWSR